MTNRTQAKKLRLVLLLALLVLAPIAARVFGLTSSLSVEGFRRLVESTGPWAPVAFTLVFVVAVVAQVPGFAFVIAAPAMFRLPLAWLLCFLASNVAVLINFALVRRFGGQPLAKIERSTLRRIFAQLDAHPIRTVALLRTLTVMFPPVTGALALTQVSARDHAIGSILGMIVPVTAILAAAAALMDALPP